jgi:hypothetical protein
MDDNTETFIIELKCQILDILFSKKLQGQDEITVLELLEELGMDAHTNATGLDIRDTIVLTDKALQDLQATKEYLRRSKNSSIH